MKMREALFSRVEMRNLISAEKWQAGLIHPLRQLSQSITHCPFRTSWVDDLLTQAQGVTLRPCLVYRHTVCIWTSQFLHINSWNLMLLLQCVNYLCWCACVKKIYTPRWRNWRLKSVGVQDKTSKIYPAQADISCAVFWENSPSLENSLETAWAGSTIKGVL